MEKDVIMRTPEFKRSFCSKEKDNDLSVGQNNGCLNTSGINKQDNIKQYTSWLYEKDNLYYGTRRNYHRDKNCCNIQTGCGISRFCVDNPDKSKKHLFLSTITYNNMSIGKNRTKTFKESSKNDMLRRHFMKYSPNNLNHNKGLRMAYEKRLLKNTNIFTQKKIIENRNICKQLLPEGFSIKNTFKYSKLNSESNNFTYKDTNSGLTCQNNIFLNQKLDYRPIFNEKVYNISDLRISISPPKNGFFKTQVGHTHHISKFAMNNNVLYHNYFSDISYSKLNFSEKEPNPLDQEDSYRILENYKRKRISAICLLLEKKRTLLKQNLFSPDNHWGKIAIYDRFFRYIVYCFKGQINTYHLKAISRFSPFVLITGACSLLSYLRKIRYETTSSISDLYVVSCLMSANFYEDFSTNLSDVFSFNLSYYNKLCVSFVSTIEFDFNLNMLDIYTFAKMFKLEEMIFNSLYR